MSINKIKVLLGHKPREVWVAHPEGRKHGLSWSIGLGFFGAVGTDSACNVFCDGAVHKAVVGAVGNMVGLAKRRIYQPVPLGRGHRQISSNPAYNSVAGEISDSARGRYVRAFFGKAGPARRRHDTTSAIRGQRCRPTCPLSVPPHQAEKIGIGVRNQAFARVARGHPVAWVEDLHGEDQVGFRSLDGGSRSRCHALVTWSCFRD